MDIAQIEKLTLLVALTIAVVMLWRGYVSARDETIATLRAELEECQNEKDKQAKDSQ